MKAISAIPRLLFLLLKMFLWLLLVVAGTATGILPIIVFFQGIANLLDDFKEQEVRIAIENEIAPFKHNYMRVLEAIHKQVGIEASTAWWSAFRKHMGELAFDDKEKDVYLAMLERVHQKKPVRVLGTKIWVDAYTGKVWRPGGMIETDVVLVLPPIAREN